MNLPFSQPGRDGPGSAFDARPIVAGRRQDGSGWWFAGGAIIAAALLFTALEARRRGVEQADKRSTDVSAFAAPETIPELVVPVLPADHAAVSSNAWPQPGDAQQSRLPMPARPGRISAAPTSAPPPPYAGGNPYLPPPPPLLVSGEATPTIASAQPIGGGSPSSPAGPDDNRRIVAGRLENPASTVIQGTLIYAVLETALDSNSPGQTRAVVTRDIHGFDGTRVLIPRGSRLYGVYEGDVAQGQNRAQIRWTRLLRPDGVSVALDSPAADPLGRAGVRAKVNNHFMQRLGNAFLGTAASIGSTLVTRGVGNSPVIVAVPESAKVATQTLVPSSSEIVPTLTVRQGTRITIFVQHDLDFSSVDQVP